MNTPINPNNPNARGAINNFSRRQEIDQGGMPKSTKDNNDGEKLNEEEAPSTSEGRIALKDIKATALPGYQQVKRSGLSASTMKGLKTFSPEAMAKAFLGQSDGSQNVYDFAMTLKVGHHNALVISALT